MKTMEQRVEEIYNDFKNYPYKPGMSINDTIKGKGVFKTESITAFLGYDNKPEDFMRSIISSLNYDDINVKELCNTPKNILDIYTDFTKLCEDPNTKIILFDLEYIVEDPNIDIFSNRLEVNMILSRMRHRICNRDISIFIYDNYRNFQQVGFFKYERYTRITYLSTTVFSCDINGTKIIKSEVVDIIKL